MGNVYMTQRFRDDLELVSLGTVRGRRNLEVDAAVSAAVKHLGQEPTTSDHELTFNGFEFSPRDRSKRLVGELVVRTIHLRRFNPTAVHALLYRIDGDGDVEVGRLLHDDMFIPEHIPVSWLAEMLLNDAA